MSPMLMMLLMKIYQTYEELPVKPPVTFALVGYNVAAHIYPSMALPFSLDQICVSGDALLRALAYGDAQAALMRVVLSAFAHADDMHLYYNMGSLLIKGVLLEQNMGSELFGAFVAYSIFASAALTVVLGFMANSLGYAPGCAVGFSAVLFSMKVVLNYGSHTPGSQARTSVWGVKVASRHAHWLEIVVSSYFNPRSSMVGHASGAIAGIIWTLGPQVLRLIEVNNAPRRSRATNAARNVPPRNARYTYAAGTAATPPAPAPAPAPQQDDWEEIPPANNNNNDAQTETLRQRRLARFNKEKS